MSNRTSIFCVVAGEEPSWSPGTPYSGHFKVTDRPIPPEVTGTADAWDVYHCAPGTEPPDNCTSVVIKGHETPWTPEMIVAGWPNGAPYVMEATWPDTGAMGAYQRRGKMVDIPEGVEPTETNLVPHRWAGDGQQ